MKLSEKLFNSTVLQWDEASENAFVTAMADGTLDKQKFKAYMLQDYYYLTDYIDILECMQEQAKDARVSDFLKNEAEAVLYEKDTVHLPNLRELGISDEEIRKGGKAPESTEYLQYLKTTASEGTIRGLTALLQCSWSYAYIARTVTDRYSPERIDRSPYSGWFRAYTSEEYTAANNSWINILDQQAGNISTDEEEILCSIFKKCAQYEKGFWNIFITEE